MIKQILRSILGILDWQTQQKIRELYALVNPRTRIDHFRYTSDIVDGAPKHTNVTALIDRLLRYQIAMKEKLPFSGRTVLEVGSGPLLGWGMVALALGATKFYALEPAFRWSLLTQYQEYFEDHWRQVNRFLGPVDRVEDLIAQHKIEVLTEERITLPNKSIDLVVSNSVVEHVDDLEELIEELRRISSDEAVQFHFVDLKDHSSTGRDRFSRLYPFHPEYLRSLYKRRGSPINMLRARDIKNLFSRRFNYQQIIFFENSHHPSIISAHQYWAERYTSTELGIETIGIKITPKID
jgi:SAM-dependent methyltransferase